MTDSSKPVDLERARKAALPPAERQHIVKALFIEHDRFTNIIDFVGRRHKPVEGGGPDYGSISVVYGESRAGKSVALQHYAKQHSAAIEGMAVRRPVIYVETPSEATPRALMEEIATALNFGFGAKLRNSGLEAALIRELLDQRVELLIIDELQEVFDAHRKKAAKTVRAFFRKILNRRSLNLVVVGLPETYNGIFADKQLLRRGMAPRAFVEPYLWGDAKQQMEFRLLCDCLDDGLPLLEKSGLGTIDMASRLYWVCDGLIGCLAEFIHAAACMAINDKSARVEVKHLAEAWEERRPPKMMFNPFIDNMNLAPAKDPSLDENNIVARNQSKVA